MAAPASDQTRENSQQLTFASVFADNSPAPTAAKTCRTSLDSVFSASYTYYSDFEFWPVPILALLIVWRLPSFRAVTHWTGLVAALAAEPRHHDDGVVAARCQLQRRRDSQDK
jgi:hypothetical protein